MFVNQNESDILLFPLQKYVYNSESSPAGKVKNVPPEFFFKFFFASKQFRIDKKRGIIYENFLRIRIFEVPRKRH